MPKKREKEWFKCYSYPLKNFIEAHNIYPISSGVHPRTSKVYHLFTMTDELSRILHNWSNNKKNVLKE